MKTKIKFPNTSTPSSVSGMKINNKDVLYLKRNGVTYYTRNFKLTTNLDGVSLSGDTVFEGKKPFRVEFVVEAGLVLLPSTVIVTMGGVDITSASYDGNNTINIASVVGDVDITAVAVIVFADAHVKSICVTKCGGKVVSGEITKNEAASVKYISWLEDQQNMETFNELRFFTGLVHMPSLYNSSLMEITLPRIKINLSSMFENTSITTLHANGSDWSGTSDFNYTFYEAFSLQNITGPVTGIYSYLSLSDCSNLTRDSILVLINGLADLSGKSDGQTLRLHRNAKARLTADDIAIATAKNWIIS